MVHKRYILIEMTRREALDRISEIASDQSGYLTTAQAERRGVDRTILSDLVESGDLRRVRRGVYATRGAGNPHERDVTAWLSVERKPFPWEWKDREPRALISHASAASIWDLGTIVPERPSLTVRGALPKSRFEIHTTGFGPDDWSWQRPGGGALHVPVTTPARTIVDLAAAGEEPDYVDRALREAIGRGLATEPEVRSVLERRPRKGPRVARLSTRLGVAE